MKGAVLHRLGMNFVKERRMRRNYGIRCQTPFKMTIHPEHLKGLDPSGETVCTKAVEWCAYKVSWPRVSFSLMSRVARWQTVIRWNLKTTTACYPRTNTPVVGTSQSASQWWFVRMTTLSPIKMIQAFTPSLVK